MAQRATGRLERLVVDHQPHRLETPQRSPRRRVARAHPAHHCRRLAVRHARSIVQSSPNDTIAIKPSTRQVVATQTPRARLAVPSGGSFAPRDA